MAARMIERRDLIVGGLCVAGAMAANALKPRRNVPLLASGQLADIVPARFGPWISEDVGDPLAVNGPETLSAKLYNQLLVRLYQNQETGAQVLMLLAYGGRQTDELQLHRPEVCYPAFGYELTRNEAIYLPIRRDISIPARRLLAKGEERTESIVYWSRIGETLPVDAAEQRRDRFRIALQGVIPDGLLSRFSTVPTDAEAPWTDIEEFVPKMVGAIGPAQRKVLIGSTRAHALAG